MTCSLGAVPGRTNPQALGVCSPYSTGFIHFFLTIYIHLFIYLLTFIQIFIEWLCDIFDFRKTKTGRHAVCHGFLCWSHVPRCPRLAKSVNAEVWAVYFLSMCLRWENWGGQERHGASWCYRLQVQQLRSKHVFFHIVRDQHESHCIVWL